MKAAFALGGAASLAQHSKHDPCCENEDPVYTTFLAGLSQ